MTKVGRPLKYEGEETIRKSKEYIEGCLDEVEKDKDGKVIDISANLPKAEGLAKKLGVRRETLYDWANKYPEFSNILEMVNQEQVERLINMGLSNKYNPTIAKLVLAKHGYKESLDHTSDGEKIETVTVNINAPRTGSDTSISKDSQQQE